MNNVRVGAPLATVEDVLVPLYLLHRYQVEAACKLVGGMDYTFALRGDGQKPTQIVKPGEQRRTLAAALATLKPEVLALPESVLQIIPPRPPGYPPGREHFKTRTAPAFDALAPAEAAPHGDGYTAQIANAVDDVTLFQLLALARDAATTEEVRAVAGRALHDLHEWLTATLDADKKVVHTMAQSCRCI